MEDRSHRRPSADGAPPRTARATRRRRCSVSHRVRHCVTSLGAQPDPEVCFRWGVGVGV